MLPVDRRPSQTQQSRILTRLRWGPHPEGCDGVGRALTPGDHVLEQAGAGCPRPGGFPAGPSIVAPMLHRANGLGLDGSPWDTGRAQDELLTPCLDLSTRKWILARLRGEMIFETALTPCRLMPDLRSRRPRSHNHIAPCQPVVNCVGRSEEERGAGRRSDSPERYGSDASLAGTTEPLDDLVLPVVIRHRQRSTNAGPTPAPLSLGGSRPGRRSRGTRSARSGGADSRAPDANQSERRHRIA